MIRGGLAEAPWLAGFEPADEKEHDDFERLSALLTLAGDPFDRRSEIHLTGSALILHPPTRRVLLRWHTRQHDWLQVGGHGDPGEEDPYAVARREAAEETGLFDLVPFPAAARPVVCHLVVVPVAGRGDEGPHEHLDVRYLLATSSPDAVRPESPTTPLRWSPIELAVELASDNLAETMRRAMRHLPA